MTSDEVRALFARLDQLDADALASAMTFDGEVVFGNTPPARGATAIRASLGGLFHILDGADHHVDELWEVPDGVIVQLTVTYRIRRSPNPVPLTGLVRLKTSDAGLQQVRFAFDLNPVLAEAKAAQHELPVPEAMPIELPAIQHRTSARGGVFEVPGDDEPFGLITYVRSNDELAIIDHTYVSPAARGTGLGIRLVEAVSAWARQQGVRILPLCPFARSVYARRPELRDVLAQG